MALWLWGTTDTLGLRNLPWLRNNLDLSRVLTLCRNPKTKSCAQPRTGKPTNITEDFSVECVLASQDACAVPDVEQGGGKRTSGSECYSWAWQCYTLEESCTAGERSGCGAVEETPCLAAALSRHGTAAAPSAVERAPAFRLQQHLWSAHW